MPKIGIVASSAFQLVITCTSIDEVITSIAVDCIIPSIAAKNIICGSSINPVIVIIAVTTDRSDALAAQNITGTDNNDTLTGGNFDDTLSGNSGDDVVDGGAGNDTIYGDSGNDTLIGGKGNDRLEGSYGDDTYIWNLGDGFDTIYDDNRGNTDNDTIKFGEGISFEDLLFERDGNSLIIHVNNDRTQGISIQDYYSSTYYKVEKLEFADGTIVETSTITF